MAKRLWNYYGGEPFLDNPHLAIVGNPKGEYKEVFSSGKQKGKNMARASSAKRRMAYVRSFRKNGRKRPMKLKGARRNPRRRYRRNPWPIAGVAINPPRHRRSYRRNRVHHSRHHYRRNPALFGLTLPPMQSVLFAAGGYIGTPYLEGLINGYFTSLSSSTMGKFAVKIGALLGLTFAAKEFAGTQQAQMVAVGGSIYVIQCAINDFSPGLLPAVTLSGYVPGNRPNMNGMRGVRGYVAANQRINNGLGYRQAAFPGAQPHNVVPTRFNRF